MEPKAKGHRLKVKDKEGHYENEKVIYDYRDCTSIIAGRM